MVADNTGGWLVRVRSTAGVGQVYRGGVFVAGVLLIVLGFALVLVPGPFTIPPVLLGLWIWSTEFPFAQRLFQSVKRRGRSAWERVQTHPVVSTFVVLGGLATNGVAAWVLV
jgi:hypothetical protein